MAKSKVKVTNKKGKPADEAIKKVNERINNKVGKEIRAKSLAAAIFLESEIKRAIKNEPLVDTGRLLNSISHTEPRKKANQPIIRTKVGSTIKDPKYPTFLEFGTSKMSPKPFVRPTFNKNKENITKILKNGIKEGIKEGVK